MPPPPTFVDWDFAHSPRIFVVMNYFGISLMRSCILDSIHYIVTLLRWVWRVSSPQFYK